MHQMVAIVICFIFVIAVMVSVFIYRWDSLPVALTTVNVNRSQLKHGASVLAVRCHSVNRKLKLESELAAQLWRVSWDDVQINNLDKVLRRTCSRLTMSLVTHKQTQEDVQQTKLLNKCIWILCRKDPTAALSWLWRETCRFTPKLDTTRCVVQHLKTLWSVWSEELNMVLLLSSAGKPGSH